MALELTGKIDALRQEVSKMFDDRSQPPKRRAALKEILDLLGEAADEAEEAGL
jgi:hypothetical protein